MRCSGEQQVCISNFTIIVVTILAGCATAPRPFSIEEKFWHDNATGAVFNGIETLGRKREGP
jgi:hypothetical protein